MRRLFSIALLLAASVGWSSAQQIIVPLEYRDKSDYYANPPIAFSSVKIAPFDMLAPGAAEAPLSVDFTTTAASRGIKNESYQSAKEAVVGGRQCVKGELSLTLDDPTSRSSQGDLWLLLDYYDEAERGARLQIRYPANIMGQCVPALVAEELGFENTRTWKQRQFLLKSAWFGGKAGNHVTRGPRIRAVSNGCDFLPTGHASLQVTTAPIAGLRAPETVTTQPLYAQTRLGDTTCSLMFDKTSADLSAYNRVVADLNHNNDLTDEKPVVVTEQWQLNNGYVSLPVATSVTLNGRQFPYAFVVSAGMRANESGKPATPYGALTTEVCYGGKLVVKGREYSLSVSDGNGNGRFDDGITSSYTGYRMGVREPVYYASDNLFICPADRRMWYDDGGPTGMLFIGGELYDVKVDIDSAVMRLTPFAGKTARLRTAMDVENITFVSSDLTRSVYAVSVYGREIIVPEGEWTPAGYTLRRRDGDGAEWRLVAIPSSKAQTVKATSDAPVALSLGEPYRLFLSVPDESVAKVRAGGEKAELEYVAVGRGEEIVLRMELEKGTPLSTAMTTGDRLGNPKEPAYLVATPDGEVVAKGAFEYG